jgi:hypothetical protein
MPVAVTSRTAYIIGAVLAQLPIHYNAGGDSHVAFGAWVIYLHTRLSLPFCLALCLWLLRAHCAQPEKHQKDSRQ